MKRYLFSFLLAFAILVIFSVKESSAQFRIDAEFRPRFEFRQGYKEMLFIGEVPSFIVSQRSRLRISYQSESLKLRFTPQDVRVWGDEELASATGVYGDQAAIDLYEAVAEIKIDSSIWISVGRQPLVYDNQRLLSERGWNQFGLSYDAVVLKFHRKKYDIHLAGSWNTLSESLSNNFYPSDRIKSLNFIWINREFTDDLSAALSHIASGVTQTDTTNTLYFRQTTGLYINYKWKNLKSMANVYYQFGRNKTGNHVSAFLADADVAYQINRVTPGIGFGYLSGDKLAENSTDNLFDVLYGARHKFFGHMDFFTNIPASTKRRGLVDMYAYVNYKMSNKVNIKNTGHYFQLAQNYDNPPYANNLGYEHELEVKYKFSEWGTVKVSYLIFFPTQIFATFHGADKINYKTSQFAFVELLVSPTLWQQ